MIIFDAQAKRQGRSRLPYNQVQRDLFKKKFFDESLTRICWFISACNNFTPGLCKSSACHVWQAHSKAEQEAGFRCHHFCPPCTKINQIQIGQISWYAKENWERSSHRRQQQRRREEERMQIQPKRPQEPQSLNFTRPCPSFRSRAMVSLHCQHFNKTVLGQFFTAKIGNFYPFESHKVTIAYSFSH